MAALCVFLTAACYCDYRKKKIPNVLVASMFFAGIGWKFLGEGPGGIAMYLLQAVLTGSPLYLLFKTGAVGAGDVKLFGAAAGYLPFQKIFVFLFVSLLVAAMISLIKLWRNKIFYERLRHMAEYVAGVLKSGRWRLYQESGETVPDITVCLSGPALASLLLLLGGVY